MTKKRSSSLFSSSSCSCSVRFYFWLGFKVVLLTSVVLCIFAIFRIQSPTRTPREAAIFLRSSTPHEPFVGTPKVAFLFLARASLPLDFLWHNFFTSADSDNFSIYIHSKPGIVFDRTTSRSAFFYGRQLRHSIHVAWGESSMIEAERLLLGAALQDPANQRFFLVSDSCVPLFNFSYIYNYVMASPKSFVDSFLDAKEGRYNPMMSPTIPKEKWRKGSQWITLVRDHAEVVVADDIVFPVFKRYCKRRPPLDIEGKPNAKPIFQKEHNCIPDEHYVQTLLAMSELEDEVERRTLTYTLWNQSANEMQRFGWHPITFKYSDASPEKIKALKEINHVNYDTEFRTEWCKSNTTAVPCFLFARKFSRGAAMRLLNGGVVGPFDATSLLAMTS